MSALTTELDTAATILAAARERLLIDGYAGLSTRKVARQAGMYAQDWPLWRRYEQACDFLEDDLGPFEPAEVATLIGNAFIGSEALLLFERKGAGA